MYARGIAWQTKELRRNQPLLSHGSYPIPAGFSCCCCHRLLYANSTYRPLHSNTGVPVADVHASGVATTPLPRPSCSTAWVYLSHNRFCPLTSTVYIFILSVSDGGGGGGKRGAVILLHPPRGANTPPVERWHPPSQRGVIYYVFNIFNVNLRLAYVYTPPPNIFLYPRISNPRNNPEEEVEEEVPASCAFMPSISVDARLQRGDFSDCWQLAWTVPRVGGRMANIKSSSVWGISCIINEVTSH